MAVSNMPPTSLGYEVFRDVHCAVQIAGTNISDEPAASIFRVEEGGGSSISETLSAIKKRKHSKPSVIRLQLILMSDNPD
jgi:hypothetical protein